MARRLKLSRNTVRKYLQAETFAERSRPPYRGSILDPYKPYLLERWKSGCWNGAQLLEEIKKLGYTGSDALFRSFMTPMRKQHQAAGTALALELSTARGSISASDDLPAQSSPKRRMSPSRASWLCMCQQGKLDEQQRPLVEQLRAAHPDLETAYQSFAQGIRRDYAAVKAAFSSKWSHGQVEAQVNWRTAAKKAYGLLARILTYCGCMSCGVPNGAAISC